MSVEFGLTAEERARMIPSGRAKLMDNRIGWSLTHLSQAGLIERPVRAQVKITPAGLEVVRSHPDRVDVSVLRDYPVYREFRERSRAKQPVDMRDSGETSSPEDLIDAAVAENRAAVEGEILKKVLALSPTGFENLVIALLEAMGYGARRVDPAYERHRRRGHRWRHQPGPTRARPDLYAGQAVCD